MKNFLTVLFFLIATNSYSQQMKTNFYFDFGIGAIEAGYTGITGSDIYNSSTGYGFDFNTQPNFFADTKGDALKADFATSDQPFYFSVKVPEGNYKVTVMLGSRSQSGLTTIKAESRRLMLENIKTRKGEFKEETFLVNIKSRKINESTQVGLKEREKTKLDWDDKLTLEFNLQTVIYGLKIEPVTDAITVFLAGNSTVVNQEYEPWASWGQMIPGFFNSKVAIANHAESGLTLGSFLGSRRLDKILSIAKPGDYLFIEFGHNDQKEKGENDGAYKSYSERLRLYVTKFREKGGIPVILTSTSRRVFDANGNLQQTLGDFPDAARKMAKELNVALIDLNKLTKSFYEALGVEKSKLALVHYPANTFTGQAQPLADNTHFNPYGAYQIAKMVVQGIKDNNLSLKKYLKKTPDFNSVQPDDVNSWKWPESPRIDVLKPDGN
jgi:lysophospholipase L1-like esterase